MCIGIISRSDLSNSVHINKLLNRLGPYTTGTSGSVVFCVGLMFSLCRYGERSAPFCVIQLEDFHRGGGEFSRRIQHAVERAALDVESGALSDEEGGDTSMSSSCSSLSTSFPASGPTPNLEPKTIPTVSNPNSVYQVHILPISFIDIF